MLTGHATLRSAKRSFKKVQNIIPYKGRYKTDKYHIYKRGTDFNPNRNPTTIHPTNSDSATIIHQPEGYKQVISV